MRIDHPCFIIPTAYRCIHRIFFTTQDVSVSLRQRPPAILLGKQLLPVLRAVGFSGLEGRPGATPPRGHRSRELTCCGAIIRCLKHRVRCGAVPSWHRGSSIFSRCHRRASSLGTVLKNVRYHSCWRADHLCSPVVAGGILALRTTHVCMYVWTNGFPWDYMTCLEWAAKGR